MAAGLALLAPSLALAQTVATPPGPYLEAEGQRAFGRSSAEVGLVPSLSSSAVRAEDADEGDGRGGALALGYAWSNGWSAAVRARRLEADDAGGLIVPGIIVYTAGAPFPGGLPTAVPDARVSVESRFTTVAFEVGKDVAVAGGRLTFVGGVAYAKIDRDSAIESCTCAPFALLLGSSFEGVGPRIGLRGGLPLGGGVSLVGAVSAAALIGSSRFDSRVSDPGFPSFAFRASDDRVVAALDGELGLAFQVGAGALAIGYRADALLGALDTDQRVSSLFREAGLPAIGDRHDDFVAHGPFARLTLPLAAAGD